MAFKDFFKIQKQGLEGMASVGVIGMHMVSGPLVGVAIGYGIDRFLDTHPWGKIVFLFIGIGAGFLNVWMDTKRLIGRMNKAQGQAQGADNRAPVDSPAKANSLDARARETSPTDPEARNESGNKIDRGAGHGKV